MLIEALDVSNILSLRDTGKKIKTMASKGTGTPKDWHATNKANSALASKRKAHMDRMDAWKASKGVRQEGMTRQELTRAIVEGIYRVDGPASILRKVRLMGGHVPHSEEPRHIANKPELLGHSAFRSQMRRNTHFTKKALAKSAQARSARKKAQKTQNKLVTQEGLYEGRIGYVLKSAGRDFSEAGKVISGSRGRRYKKLAKRVAKRENNPGVVSNLEFRIRKKRSKARLATSELRGQVVDQATKAIEMHNRAKAIAPSIEAIAKDISTWDKKRKMKSNPGTRPRKFNIKKRVTTEELLSRVSQFLAETEDMSFEEKVHNLHRGGVLVRSVTPGQDKPTKSKFKHGGKTYHTKTKSGETTVARRRLLGLFNKKMGKVYTVDKDKGDMPKDSASLRVGR